MQYVLRIQSGAFFAGFLALLFGCQAAKYEIVGKQRVSPTCDPAVEDCDGNIKINGLPSARVQVFHKGEEVSHAPINESVIIRPSEDTMDPDDLLNPDCGQNPGIVKVEYKIGDIESTEINRSPGNCEDLGFEYNFKKPGEYPIYMKVTSNENETADAQMILKVIDPSKDNSNEDLGFYIVVKPLIIEEGEGITAQAFCKTVKANTIEWDFGNGEKGKGTYVTFRYTKAGQYKVTAYCKSGDKIYISWVTVSVVNFDLPDDDRLKPIKPPGTGCGDGKGDGPGQNQQEPGQTNQEPGQDPGQNKGGGGTGECEEDKDNSQQQQQQK